MKVLMVIDSKFSGNPFISTLCQQLNKKNIDTTMSLEKLWSSAGDYDIIHFHWPEAIYRWRSNITADEVTYLDKTINKAKQKGTKIVITCHNLKPHTINTQNVISIYEIIYKYADLFLHMGNYSLQYLISRYPYAKHCILPHHIYNSIYKFDKSKTECRNILGLEQSKCNILCFGEFRNSKERKTIIKLTNKFKNQNIIFTTPGFYRKKIITRRIWEIPQRIINTIYYKALGIKFNNHFLNEKITETYFCAADIVLIQRLQILNSGNLPMAYAAGKIVVGPNIGNVGEILLQTENPVFDPNNLDSISRAINKAIELQKTNLGFNNKEYAIKNWSEEMITEKLIQYYTEI